MGSACTGIPNSARPAACAAHPAIVPFGELARPTPLPGHLGGTRPPQPSLVDVVASPPPRYRPTAPLPGENAADGARRRAIARPFLTSGRRALSRRGRAAGGPAHQLAQLLRPARQRRPAGASRHWPASPRPPTEPWVKLRQAGDEPQWPDADMRCTIPPQRLQRAANTPIRGERPPPFPDRRTDDLAPRPIELFLRCPARAATPASSGIRPALPAERPRPAYPTDFSNG